MKREIEFRGKRVGDGKWVYGSYFKATLHWHERGIHEDWIATRVLQNGGWCNVISRHAVVPETVGQYTGIKDKNGKKVYVGDIVEEGDKIGVVKFGEGTFDSGFYRYMGFYYEEENGKIDQNSIYDIDEDWAKIEVIGNIFDRESEK